MAGTDALGLGMTEGATGAASPQRRTGLFVHAPGTGHPMGSGPCVSSSLLWGSTAQLGWDAHRPSPPIVN